MRLLLILIMIIASTPSHSDMYNEKGEYVEYEYYTVSSEEAALNAVIGAVGFLLSEEGRERNNWGVI
ncbi:hypothetical protein [Psychromonas sp. Urea-02u-13]|uniref:hypothetical protein n=1 Tax=Psychromonas sp. Urea-02u-13 TaxID=2058326 RepID=UPI000C341856|nr:hypothetical protein [Psychromonas sp. Urea-02u-13]PKG37131.1 hypothetical protein CXF74_20475 [Psychromonas sp. Urea-02u-13]